MGKMSELSILEQNLDVLSHREFVDYVFDLLEKEYSEMKIERGYSRDNIEFDIYLESDEEKFVVDIKKRRLVGKDEILKLGIVWDTFSVVPDFQIILVISGTLTSDARKEAIKYDIKVIDLYELFKIESNLRKIKFKEHSLISKEASLIQNLENTPCGGNEWQKEWSKYQKLISDILENLFTPPLESPRYEYSDLTKKNRRDIIFENSSEIGFWKQVRSKYQGDYIVVDAKNYSEPIKKKSVIEIAHYLKPYGCGLFGLLVSRHKESDSSFDARKEQWISSMKMIISLNDEDIIEMLNIKISGGKPEELIRRKIADFRMKL